MPEAGTVVHSGPPEDYVATRLSPSRSWAMGTADRACEFSVRLRREVIRGRSQILWSFV